MDCFELIAPAVDVRDIQDELIVHNDEFGKIPLRTAYEGSSHREATDILLRGPDLYSGKEWSMLALQNEILCVPLVDKEFMPAAQYWAKEVMKGVGGVQLGRVIITKLPAGGKIYEHVDEGDAADWYDRFHLVIQGGEGDVFHSADETVTMYTGELWWVENQADHSVENNMDTDRIHMIMDIRID